MQQDSQYLIDIFQAAQRILEDTFDVTRQSFREDVYLQDKIMRRLLTISKTAQRVSYDTREQWRELTWCNIDTMKQRILEAEPHLDTERIWQIVQTEIPSLVQTFSGARSSPSAENKSFASSRAS